LDCKAKANECVSFDTTNSNTFANSSNSSVNNFAMQIVAK
jgi:hypothetical protein